jgi:hypothetical protein
VVLATNASSTARLLHEHPPPTRGTTCFQFAAEQPPLDDAILVVNAEGAGPVNSLLCPSNLSSRYAPAGASLVTVNCLGAPGETTSLVSAARDQLRSWYGPPVDRWVLVATYSLPEALPEQRRVVSDPAIRPLRLANGIWCCGETNSAPSIHWALHTGRRAAAEIAASL